MIIVCPSCSKNFNVRDDQIPDKGRLLQCSNCKHEWFYTKNTIPVDNDIDELSNDDLTQESFSILDAEKDNDTSTIVSVLAGLGSGLFTKDLSRAHRVSKEIKAGICWINTYRVISPIAAFGGFNQSGYAREAGKQSILDYTRTKTTWINTSDEPMKNPFIMR